MSGSAATLSRSAGIERIKRVEDVAGAVLLLAAAAPLMSLALVTLWLTGMRRPLFSQRRVGLEGRVFTILKLRTLKDGRVTVLGSLLRMTSIDELPQLFNVLSGEMSLVGPRPHPIKLHRRYERVFGPALRQRHSVKPGMTGLAQISGARGAIRCDADMRLRLALDLKYVRQWSLWLDIAILTRTMTYGFLSISAARRTTGHEERELGQSERAARSLDSILGAPDGRQRPRKVRRP